LRSRSAWRACRRLRSGETSLERRSSDVSPERKRLQARQALRERKADEAYQEWLRQLRDSTYVELRLDER